MANTHLLIFGHDLVIAGTSLVIAYYLRVGNNIFAEQYMEIMPYGVMIFMAIAGFAFRIFGMYRGVWRYASLSDLVAILKAVTLAVLVFTLVMFALERLASVPRSVPIIQWFVLVVMLAGSRVAYRLLRAGSGFAFSGRDHAARVPVLLVGAGDGAAMFIRAMDSAPDAPYSVAGIVDDGGGHLGRMILGVPVLGGVDDLETIVERLQARGRRPQRLILAEAPGRLRGEALRDLVDRAEALALIPGRLPSLVEFKSAIDEGHIDLRPIALEDLLGRPQVRLNRGAASALIEGRRVLVTGAGGSIGSELVRQIADLHPAHLIVSDASELNLYNIELELAERQPHLARSAALLDVRDQRRVQRLFAQIRPEIVFHAAALKHVPMVEANPIDGVLTNVFGTRHVADAACAVGCQAMVLISSDKAVNPTNVMGATKRLAEFYCQALDLAGRSGGNGAPATRLMTVRFGNVLGSSGSVVHLFRRQLARGGPLTVTHPEIRRYFMTIEEAVALVLQASARGLEDPARRGQIFVLDMGKPVPIVELARRIIRLAGQRPEMDVDIRFIGLRRGEKLHEELFDPAEQRLPELTEGVLAAVSCARRREELEALLKRLRRAVDDGDEAALCGMLGELLPSYRAYNADLVPAVAAPELQVPAHGSSLAAAPAGH